MSDKKFVCKLDNRRFLTKAGLEQHSVDQHSGRSKTAKTRSEKPKMMAPVAVPQRVVGNATDMAKMSGTDRLASVQLRTSMVQGDVLVDLTIEPSVFKRLYLASRVYQRIRYHRIRFRVEPQVSTATSGGYVVGFVHDPDDDSKHLNLDVLTSQRGSVTTKWWQSASIDVTVGSRLFFTNLGTEKREFSPGKLVVICDGKPSLAGNFTVFCEWSAELTVATLDMAPAPSPQPGPTPEPGWNYDFAQLWCKDKDGSGTDVLPRVWTKVEGVFTSAASVIIPKAKKNAIYELPGIVAISTIAQDHIETRQAWLRVIDANTVRLVDDKGADIYKFDDEVLSDYQFAFHGKAKEKVLKTSLEDRVRQLEQALKLCNVDIPPDDFGSDWDLDLRPEELAGVSGPIP